MAPALIALYAAMLLAGVAQPPPDAPQTLRDGVAGCIGWNPGVRIRETDDRVVIEGKVALESELERIRTTCAVSPSVINLTELGYVGGWVPQEPSWEIIAAAIVPILISFVAVSIATARRRRLRKRQEAANEIDLSHASDEQLERMIDDAFGSEELRLRAMNALVLRCTPEKARPLLLRLFGSEVPAIRRLAISKLGNSRDPELTELFLAAHRLDEDVLVPIAEALGQLGGAAAEDQLLILVRHKDPAVRVAAMRSLGDIGTLRAVEPLLPASKSLLGDPAVRTAAVTTIAEIRRRHARRAKAGEISIAAIDEPSGELTLAPDGQLALSEDER